MYKSIVIKFVFLFIILSIAIIGFFYSNYKISIEKLLETKTNKHFLEYKAIYDKQKDIANIIFNTEINTPTILKTFNKANFVDEDEKTFIRKELYKLLEEKYKKLKKYNLRQLHFHLPNNESFLRMHRPSKFGDDLSSFRATVKYVNENKKYIHGFEEGRVYNGFRFVYPLNYKNKHIGSVEVSFSSLALINTIKNTYNNESYFLIRKSIVDSKVFEDEKDNYAQSPHKDFYYEKKLLSKNKPVSLTNDAEDLTQKILEGKSFSIFIKDKNLIKSFIPIQNPISKEIVSVLCICEEDTLIKNEFRNLIIISIAGVFALALIFYLFFMQKITNEKLRKTNKDLDRRIELEIRRNRKKDVSLLKQSKMASVAEMLNHIAHQWRQPLNVISTSSSGLIIHKEMESLDDETFYLLTKSIENQAKYLSRTIENFREFLNDHEESKKRIVLQNKIDETIKIIKASFDYEHIEIIKDYEKEDLYVTVNVGDLIQVILNILNNARDILIKNNEINNRKIEISIKHRKENILLCIEDNGGGVPEKFAEKIFDPYFTTKHESIGTGISLYLCYEIITNQERGKIYFKNKRDGAKFCIELPKS
ncbi:ATP-binding protein [Halarcobacter bivalviorum]|uniref:ATP-binding protein n=1 Tax=Halarcobacter bivalviorum TaxID=663364 RepID=UPI00100A2EFD|nr:ATP-binding protein [Halarcobacter bivalviorum]RXK07046.1 hypothetical protein CRU97_02760 [Halarcobacter bivalviorum]